MSVTTLQRRAISNPRPSLEIDGLRSPVTDELLLAMDMCEQEGGMSSLQCRFSNIASDPDGGAAYAFEDESELRLGSIINVSAGDIDAQQEIFRGVVTALEAEFPASGPPELLVLAEDNLQMARMTRRTRTWHEISLADIVVQIAQSLNLQANTDGLPVGTKTWVQLNESDLFFLRRLLRYHDTDVQVIEDRLEVAPIGDIQRELIEMNYLDDLRSVRFVADLSHQVTAVTTAGWNPQQGRAVTASSSGVNGGPGRGRPGSVVLGDSLGQRVEHVGHIPVISNDEAQALADTVFDQRARRFVCAEGKATGHPRIRVGSHLQLQGVSSRFTNTYYVVSTRHRYDVKQGYFTDFTAESSALAEAS